MPVRALNNLRKGNCWDISNAIAYAAAAGARVANMSIWDHSGCPLEEDAIAAAPNTLFAVIAGNDSEDTNGDPAYPCAFPEPNIICVAGTDSSDHLGTYSNWGSDYVDIAAPGTAIQSTYPKWGDTQTIWSDGFEDSLAGNWAVGINSDWARTTANPRSGSWSLTDSPIGNYSNGAVNYIDMLQGLNLTGRSDCAVRTWSKRSLAPGDILLGETSLDGSTLASGIVVDGSTSGYEKTYFDLGPIDGKPWGRFLLALESDSSGTADGVYLDDLDVICVPPLTNYTGASDEYALDDGTSMAAPHVAGVAALVLSLDPSMSVAQLKDRILSTADPVPGLAGRVATGGRLDAARAVEFGRRAAPGSSGPTPATSGGRPANRLAGPLGTLRKLLAHIRRAKLLRQNGFTVGLAAPAAGRFTVVLSAAAGRKAATSRAVTIATGSRSTGRAGRVTLKVRLTSPGRRILRAGAGTRATVTLRFTPKSGAGLRSSARVVLR
jgi:subtilisin family serine protease